MSSYEDKYLFHTKELAAKYSKSRVFPDFFYEFLVTGNRVFWQTQNRTETGGFVSLYKLTVVNSRKYLRRAAIIKRFRSRLPQSKPNPNPVIIWPTVAASALPFWRVRHLMLPRSRTLLLQPARRARRVMMLLLTLLQIWQFFRRSRLRTVVRLVFLLMSRQELYRLRHYMAALRRTLCALPNWLRLALLPDGYLCLQPLTFQMFLTF